MDTLLIASAYLLIGSCWANVVGEFLFDDTTVSHKILSIILWPIEIIVAGITRPS